MSYWLSILHMCVLLCINAGGCGAIPLQLLSPDVEMALTNFNICCFASMQVVVVHCFFSSSPLMQKWRLLYGYMKQHELLDIAKAALSMYAHPTFSPQVGACVQIWLQCHICASLVAHGCLPIIMRPTCLSVGMHKLTDNVVHNAYVWACTNSQTVLSVNN